MLEIVAGSWTYRKSANFEPIFFPWVNLKIFKFLVPSKISCRNSKLVRLVFDKSVLGNWFSELGCWRQHSSNWRFCKIGRFKGPHFIESNPKFSGIAKNKDSKLSPQSCRQFFKLKKCFFQSKSSEMWNLKVRVEFSQNSVLNNDTKLSSNCSVSISLYFWLTLFSVPRRMWTTGSTSFFKTRDVDCNQFFATSRTEPTVDLHILALSL